MDLLGFLPKKHVNLIFLKIAHQDNLFIILV